MGARGARCSRRRRHRAPLDLHAAACRLRPRLAGFFFRGNLANESRCDGTLSINQPSINTIKESNRAATQTGLEITASIECARCVENSGMPLAYQLAPAVWSHVSPIATSTLRSIRMRENLADVCQAPWTPSGRNAVAANELAVWSIHRATAGPDSCAAYLSSGSFHLRPSTTLRSRATLQYARAALPACRGAALRPPRLRDKRLLGYRKCACNDDRPPSCSTARCANVVPIRTR
jgi:hypothetical protein